jgi:hypothetical protein
MGAKVLASNRQDGAGAIFSLLFPKSLVVEASEAADAG